MARRAYLSLVAALTYASLAWLLPAGLKAHAVLARVQPAVYLPGVFVNSSLLDASELETLTLINQQRQAAGCPPVALDHALSIAAKNHSQDMADHNYFSHVGLDGSTFVQRAQAAKYPYQPTGELIGAGYADAYSAVEGWMGSKPHREIIHVCSNEHIGVGTVSVTGSEWGHYWTIVFGYR